jgi:hypothetical protein
VNRVLLRKIVWPLGGLLLLAVFGALTVWIVDAAIGGSATLRVVVALGWTVAFVLGWRTFRRLDGAREPTPASPRARKLETWGPVGGVIVSTMLLTFPENVQVVAMSCVTGFMWPAFYWVTRSFVVDPVRRAKLWNGRLQLPDPIMDEE